MSAFEYLRHLSSLGLCAVVTAASGCGSEPIDEAPPELSEAVDELSSYGYAGGSLVLQDTQLGAWTYEVLAKRWLRWAMGLPFSTGPITDPTGDQCDLDQSGPIWLLAGTSGGAATRSCTIPKHKALYFPLKNVWAIPPAEFVDTPEELAEFVAFAEYYFPANRDTTCSLTLRLDGEDILADTAEIDEELWVDIYDPFKIELDADNYAGGPGGQYPAALTAGHFALLMPLSPGDHTLELGGIRCEDGAVAFETSVTYHLHVDD